MTINIYGDEEKLEKAIERREKMKDKKDDTLKLLQFMVYFAIAIIFCWVNRVDAGVVVCCPYCDKDFEVYNSLDDEMFRWFPDVWACPSCGYENYIGIDNCCICGTEMPKKYRER